MFKNFNLDGGRLFKDAEKEMFELGHPYVGSEHLLLSILKSNDVISKTLEEYHLTYKSFKAELIKIVGKSNKKSQNVLYTPLLKRIIDIATDDAKENNNGIVTARHLFLAIIEEGEGIAIRLLIGMNIDIDSIYNKLTKKIFNKNLLIHEIGNVLNDRINLNEKVVGRDLIIDQMIEILLRKNKNNPLLIGMAGVGKTAIVEELTRRIVKKDVPIELLNKQVIVLEMSFLISGTKYRGEFEERLTKIIEEVKNNDNIILFIDEIHTLIGAGGAEGAIDASNILKPYLARGDIKCIGATTVNEYNKSISKDKALDRRFQTIMVNEPNKDETEYILLSIKKEYELHHNVSISKKNIQDIIQLSDKYIFNKNNPDKCIDILDSVCTKVKIKNIKNNYQENLTNIKERKDNSIKNKNYKDALVFKEKELLLSKNKFMQKQKINKNIIEEVILSRCNINVNENKNIVTNLQKELNNNKYEEKIQKELLLSIKNNNSSIKPYSLLIAGEIGVGKSYLSKIIMETMKCNIINLDMKEYSDSISISKLMGTSQGYVGYNDEFVFEQIKTNPCSIVYIDNVEKAHKNIINLLQKIITSGIITAGNGENIVFKNCYIIINWNVKKSNSVGFNSLNNIKNELLNDISHYIYLEKPNKDKIHEYIRNKLQCNNIDLINKIYQNAECIKYYYKNIDKEINNLHYLHN